GGLELIPPNKSPRQKSQEWKATAVKTLAILCERFPACFAPAKQGHRWPLKIGINKDIVAAAPGLSPVEIGRALAFYCNGRSYRQSMVAGRARIDLTGAQAGVVTEDEAAYALQLLPKRRIKQTRPVQPPAPARKKVTLSDLRESARKRTAFGGSS